MKIEGRSAVSYPEIDAGSARQELGATVPLTLVREEGTELGAATNLSAPTWGRELRGGGGTQQERSEDGSCQSNGGRDKR